MSGVTIPGTSSIAILNPDGSALLASTNLGTGGLFVEPRTLPVAGTYTILIDPSTTNVGGATLQLYDVPSDDAGSITPGGATVNVTPGVPGQNQRLTFAGTFGQRVSLNFSADTIPGTTALALVRPDGTNLTTSTVALNATRYLDALTLTMPGTYTILVDPAGANTGTMSVQLHDASEAAVSITPAAS